MLNLVSRWILSPLESCPSPMVEDWQACAAANGCAPDQIDQAAAKAEEFYPSYALPIARQYARQWDAPFHGGGVALVYCEMDITHLQAAQKDQRLTIFSSLDDAVEQPAVDSHAHLFDLPAALPRRPMLHALCPLHWRKPARPSTLRELLAALSARHVKFSASE
jgi:hypothetical protein